MKEIPIILSFIFLVLSFSYCQVDSIYNINISQRTDGSEIVDIYYDLAGPEYYYNIDLEVSFNDGDNFMPLDSISGDAGIGIQPDTSKHIVWYAGKEKSGVYSTDALIKIIANTKYITCGISKLYHEGFEYGTIPYEGNCWMDRNLGALQVKTSMYDSLSFGDAYQWGRLMDGHQIVNSDTTSVLSLGDIPGHGEFIIGSNDWRLTPNNDLWQGVDGLNNPCPPGFRIPTKSEWDVLLLNPIQMESLKFPYSGFRWNTSGYYDMPFFDTFYWTSTTNNDQSYAATWDNNYIENLTYPTYRSWGFHVRCIKDNMYYLENPLNISPIPGSIQVEEFTDISWSHNDINVEFDVFFGLSPEPPLIAHLITEKEFEPGILEYNTTYYWRIVAIYSDSVAVSSDIWSFTTRDFTCGSSVISHLDTLYGTILYQDRCWLKRNLGATDTAASFDHFDAFGDYYQWGRSTDGHQDESSLDTTELSSLNVPGHDKFILNSIPPYDWRSPKNDSLWNGVNPINNPCPQGWHVPTEFEWNEASLNWVNRGDAFDSLLLPCGGYRESTNGNIINIVDNGRYWCRTTNGNYSKYFSIDENTTSFSSSGRANGASVRCIMDEPILIPHNPYPPQDTLLQTIVVELNWICYDPEGEELIYDVYFGTNSNPPLASEGQLELNYDPGILDYDETYYWKIVAKDPHGSISEGEVWNFTIESFTCGVTEIIDLRDGQTYSTTLIDNQCWMAENLNIGTRIEGVNDQSNNGTIEKYCYDNIEDSCTIYGGLYQWNEMMSYSNQGGTQGICPNGWHIPQYFECFSLFNSLGDSSACKLSEEGTEHWLPPNSCATNESGFTGLPGGQLYYHSFSWLGINARFWTSTIDEEPQYADYWVLGEGINVYYYILKRSSGLSVRCLKD